MTIATQKELQELNISLLLNPTSWHEGMNEEADFDVLNLHECVTKVGRVAGPAGFALSLSDIPTPSPRPTTW
jgi:hypothetical protein